MRQIKTNQNFFVCLSVFILIACNEPATTSEKNKKDTTQVVSNSDAFTMPAYDPAMDP